MTDELEQIRSIFDCDFGCGCEGRPHCAEASRCLACQLREARARVKELEETYEDGAKLFEQMKCLDCGKHGDDYWLENDVWNEFVPEDKARTEAGLHTFLCSPCFEKRMGRPWRASDFQVGHGVDDFDTNRLTRVAFARAEAAEARVKELEAELSRALAERNSDLTAGERAVEVAKALRDQRNEVAVQLDVANADRARLREALEQVKAALIAADQHPDGVPDPRRPVASRVWEALASSDASDWLKERERAVAERVREACAELIEADEEWETTGMAGNAIRALDLAALLKEET